jgi:hypothetical protein
MGGNPDFLVQSNVTPEANRVFCFSGWVGSGSDGDDICNTIINFYIKFKSFSNHSHERRPENRHGDSREAKNAFIWCCHPTQTTQKLVKSLTHKSLIQNINRGNASSNFYDWRKWPVPNCWPIRPVCFWMNPWGMYGMGGCRNYAYPADPEEACC